MTLSRIQESGTYGGNSATQSFVIGWQPAVVLIVNNKTTGTTANRAQNVKIDTMSGSTYMSNNSNATLKTTNGITINSDGFSVGSNDDINDTGSTYYWVAFRAGPWLDTGTYSGSGATQSILLNRQPEFVLLAEDGTTDSTTWKNVQVAGSTALRKTGSVATESILTITSTGFDVTGTADTSGSTYHYYAFYRVVGATQHFDSGTYTGNAGTQSISLGFQPTGVIIMDSTAVAQKYPSMADDDLGVLTGTHAWETANGCTLVADGFDIGNLSSINSNAVVYNYLASRY
jgi:hypothetical protein